MQPQIFAVRYEAGEGLLSLIQAVALVSARAKLMLFRLMAQDTDRGTGRGILGTDFEGVSCPLKGFSEQDLIYSRYTFKAELLDTGTESRRLHGKQLCRSPGSINFEIAAPESSFDIFSLP